MATNPLTQIHLGAKPRGYEPVASHTINIISFAQDEKNYQEELLKICDANLWHHGSYSAGCPRPILVGQHHQEQMQNLQEALTLAIADIVQRWWSDDEARFWERMPLEKEEEELLKWLDEQVRQGNLPKFSERMGSWRPDFLVEDDENGEETYRITEINARFSFNGFMHEAYAQEGLTRILGQENSNLVGATDPEAILGGLFGLFQPSLPLHLLKGAEHGIDIFMFIDAVWRRFGIKPRLITPADLRLLPHPQSKTGYRLCCICSSHTLPGSETFITNGGEILETIHQVGLELHQHELAALEPEMLRQISLRCFNDMRTILLVHDKRMLGIVRQELAQLVARDVLTPTQAVSLDRGVVNTIISGSQELATLLHASKTSPEVRHEYILKPIRSGKGDGIVFGDDLSAEEWTAALEDLVQPAVTARVVQRRVVPRVYDLLLKAAEGMVHYPLVGTYHVVNGKLLGLGLWRASGGKIVAVCSGGSWICSVMKRDERAE